VKDKRELWLIAFGLFLGLIAAEVFSRAILEWYPIWPQTASRVFGLIYENAPHAVQTDPQGHVTRNNQWGMRGEDFPLEKPANEKRILLLGDSIAQGCGIDEKDTAAHLVTDEINAHRMPKGRTVRVLNTGAPSYNLWDYWYNLQGNGWKFKPDGIVLFVCLNDSAAKSLALPALKPGEKAPWKFRLKHALLKSRLIFLLLYKVRLRDALAYFWLKLMPAARTTVATDAATQDIIKTLDPESRAAVQKWADEEWGGSLQPVRDAFESMLLEDTWPRALPILTMMRDDAKAHGVFFKVFVFPVSFQLLPGYKDGRPQRMIMSYMQKEGIEGEDLTAAFRATGLPPKELYIPGDILHPNPAGNRATAAAIMRHLEKEFPPVAR
jgi:lysophospholipase L1-like esterase